MRVRLSPALRGVPGERLLEALVEWDLGTPAERGCCGGGIDRAPGELTGPERLEPRLDLGAGRALEALEDLQHRDLAATAEVEGAGDLGVREHREGPGDVFDMDIVAGGRPVAVEDGRLSQEEALAKDRDHAGLAVRVLPGPVDVAEPEHDVGYTMEALQRRDIGLAGLFRGAVVRERLRDVCLGRRDRRVFSVERAPG